MALKMTQNSDKNISSRHTCSVNPDMCEIRKSDEKEKPFMSSLNIHSEASAVERGRGGRSNTSRTLNFSKIFYHHPTVFAISFVDI
jgi:hypothetical protein